MGESTYLTHMQFCIETICETPLSYLITGVIALFNKMASLFTNLINPSKMHIEAYEQASWSSARCLYSREFVMKLLLFFQMNDTKGFTTSIFFFSELILLVSIYALVNLWCMLANGPRNRGSISGRVIPKTQKMVLGASFLNTALYGRDQG